MSAITIRAARPGDARRIARLDVETWRAAYAGILATQFLVGLSTQRREIGWATVIEREPRDVRVAVDAEGEIVGFGSCGRNREQRRIRRRGLYALRRAGLAEPGYRPRAVARPVRAAGRAGLRVRDHLGAARQSRPVFLPPARRPRGAGTRISSSAASGSRRRATPGAICRAISKPTRAADSPEP